MGGRARVLGRTGRRAGRRELGREALVERLDGDADGGAKRDHERRGLLRLGAVLATQRQRQADHDPLCFLLRHQLRESANPASLAARSTTVSGRASVPVASETATPVRADP